jgi:hypothetical protein
MLAVRRLILSIVHNVKDSGKTRLNRGGDET